MIKKTKYSILGALLGITAMVLSITWFSWKLALIIILALWGNNLERKNKQP